MTDETSHKLRAELLSLQQHSFNALHKDITGMEMLFQDVDNFGNVDAFGDDDATPILVSDADAIREKSVTHWKVGLGMKAMWNTEAEEWLAETDKKRKEDHKYIAGLFRDWAEEVDIILNCDDDELRAKHEEEFGS